MAYTRLIELLDEDCTTVLDVLNDTADMAGSRVVHAEFEHLRAGGCGGGSFQLTNTLINRDIDVGMFIRCSYESGTVWYVGRVEEVGYNSPAGLTVRTFGLFGMLSDVVVGGLYFGGADRLPHVYAQSDWFIDDPDHSLQSFDTCSRYDDFVTMLYNQYVQPNLPFISLGTVIQPDVDSLINGFQSQTFRGGDSVGQIIRHAATQMNNASFGVNVNNELFMFPKSGLLLDTFQEGVDCRELNYKRDKSLQYTRIWLTGDYVYYNNGSDFYRYQAVIRDVTADEVYGNKPIKLYVPWIRTVEEAFDFARGFFDQYAQPTTRVSFKTTAQSSLLVPHSGKIRVRDRDGTELANDYFSRVKIDFDAVPIFTIELGPEEIQFGTPPEPNRWELPPNLDFENGRHNPDPPVTSSSFSSFTDSYTTTIGNPSLSTPPSSVSYSTPDETTPFNGSTTGNTDGVPPDSSCDRDNCTLTISNMGSGYPAFVGCCRSINRTYILTRWSSFGYRLYTTAPCYGDTATLNMQWNSSSGRWELFYTEITGDVVYWVSSESYATFCLAVAGTPTMIPQYVIGAARCTGWNVSNVFFS